MMERIHNNRQALVLGIAMLFLLLLVPYMLLLRPQTEQMTANESEIARLEQENGIYQRKIDELKAQNADRLSDEQIAQKLPAGPDQEQIVKDLYKIGMASGVVLADATFSNESTAADPAAQNTDVSASSGIRSVYVTAHVKGGYAGIKDWMAALQKLPRLTSVEQFTIDKPYVFNGVLLEATVTFTASYLPPAGASAPDTASGEAVVPAP